MLTDKIALLEQLGSADEIWQGLQDTLKGYGIDHLIYLTVDQNFENPILRTTIPGLYDGYPPERDPFLSHCCTSYEITKTGASYLPDYEYLPEQAKTFIRRAENAGWVSGLGIPMRLQGSDRFGGFNLGTGLDRATFEAEIVPQAETLRLSCLLLHRRLEELARTQPVAATTFRDLLVSPPAAKLHQLTPREQEVAYLVASGLSRKECARLCAISPNTVSDYVKSIYRKLDINDRVKLARLIEEP